jgi:hypothetical protein
MDLMKQMDEKSKLRAGFPSTPNPDHCFLRRPGEPGVDYDPRYVANARQAVEIFVQFLSTSKKVSKDSLISINAEMHRVFKAGKSGSNAYKRLDLKSSDSQAGSDTFAEWPAGEFRPEIPAISCRPNLTAYANFINKAILHNSEPLKVGPIRIDGIPADGWPTNQHAYNPKQLQITTWHVYPSATHLDRYFAKAAPLLEEAIGAQRGSDNAVAAIAEYYFVMVNARPYASVNNGLFMAQVNTLLQFHGFEPVSHGELDHLAHRFQLQDFAPLFRQHIAGKLPSEPEPATCQCVIAHPSQPKFMAIKHKGGHLPPTVKIPYEFNLAPNINYVLDGVERKYGLTTIALRQLAGYADYQCIELEILHKDARRMQAVWVGLEDYKRIRGEDRSGYDPLADWLEETARRAIPPQRPPWERPGWFREASAWVSSQLDELDLQGVGTIVQQGAFRSAGMVLRVPTSRGKLYFKAACDKAPSEVALTRFLANRWPEHVTEVLAHDEARNWMLMPDYAPEEHVRRTPEDLAVAASAMAQIQVESTPLSGELETLGCEILGLRQLKDFLVEPELLDTVSELTGAGLADEERNQLGALAPRLADLCDRASDFDLPKTLIHPDFCEANFFLHSGSVRIIDWAGTSIGHPFFSLLKLLRENHGKALVAPERDPVARAYLEHFYEFETESRLLQALDLVIQLQHAWRLLRWSREVPYYEPGGTAIARAQRFNLGVARQLLSAHSVPTTPLEVGR